MSVSVADGPAIVAGYEYKLQIEADGPLFPAGCELVAHIRSKVSDSSPITTLSTGNGGLRRISDTIAEITIPPSATAGLAPGSVIIDMVLGGPEATVDARVSAAGLIHLITTATARDNGTFRNYDGQTIGW